MTYTIFLDIDGVLNSLDNQRSLESEVRSKLYKIPVKEWVNNSSHQIKYSLAGEGDYKFDERCKRHFNNVLEFIYNAYDESVYFDIVLVSSWQYMGIDKFQELWTDEGMYGNVVDFINKYNPERGSGILQYLKEHNITENWAALDDDAITYKDRIDIDNRYRIVIPKGEFGISYFDSKDLLEALTNKQFSHFSKN